MGGTRIPRICICAAYNKVESVFSKLLTFIVCVVLFAYAMYAVFAPVEGSKETIQIPRGESVFSIAKILKHNGLVKNELVFVTYVFLRGAHSKLRAGEYDFSHNTLLPVIVERLIGGDVLVREFKIMEGWNRFDIAEALSANHLGDKQKFLFISESFLHYPHIFDEKTSFLKDEIHSSFLEGFLFPDTYHISSPILEEEFIAMLLQNFAEKIKPYLGEMRTQKRSLYDIITMASLLEKEVKTKEDMKLVSGILWKRLAGGIPLQVDATITYLTKKRTSKVSEEDLAIDSPYNTYKHKGLPPGPIANPGLGAIEAALYPTSSPYWFYLSSREGKTIFSRTFEEHKAAKAKYLQH